MLYLTADGRQIFYRILGDPEDPALICLHGGMGLSSDYFLPWVVPLLRRGVCLVLPDHYGCGRSGRKGLEKVTLNTWAEDVFSLVTHLELRQPVLLGHSFGGFVAQQVALTYPAAFSKLILCCTAPSLDYGLELQEALRVRATPQQLAAMAFLEQPVTSDGSLKELFWEVLPLYFHRWSEGPAKVLLESTRYSAAGCNQGNFAVALGYDLRQSLPQISLPTLVLAGGEDIITPLSQARIMCGGIPGGEMAIIEGGGHFPFVEQELSFARIVADYVLS